MGTSEIPTIIRQTTTCVSLRRQEAEETISTSVDFARLSICLYRVFIAEDDNYCRNTSDKTSPTLACEDIAQHGTPPANRRAICASTGTHRAIRTDANAKEDTKNA